MRFIWFCFLGTCLAISSGVNGQSLPEGIIFYEVKQKITRRPPATGTAGATTNKPAPTVAPPTYNISKHQLVFNAQESLYKAFVPETDDLDINGNFKYSYAPPKNDIYVQAGNLKKVSVRENMGKVYVITDTLKIMPWKFGNETKDILGYNCKQAILANSGAKTTTVAWYTDKLRPSLGPENYCTLPGAVLEVDYNKGDRILKATKIDLRVLRKKELVEPTKGKKMTEKEYQAMQAEQMKKRSSGNTSVTKN